jgi:hypothetical protein
MSNSTPAPLDDANASPATIAPVVPVESFFFDEFFGSDEGVEILLPIRGRSVPLRIKRGLTLREKAAAEGKAIKRSVNLKTGQITVEGIDEAAAAEEIAFQMLLSWPFTHRDGSPVPLTRENAAKLLGGLDTLVGLVKKIEEEGDAALAPFVARSATA